MMVSSVFSCVAVAVVFTYAGVTLSYGEEDDEIFHHHIEEVVGASCQLLIFFYHIAATHDMTSSQIISHCD